MTDFTLNCGFGCSSVDGCQGHCDAPNVLRDITDERRRQIDVEGWTPEHDNGYKKSELAFAAISYATPFGVRQGIGSPCPPTWPWDERFWKPDHDRRMLVKAGALIVAEIERIDRERGGA